LCDQHWAVVRTVRGRLWHGFGAPGLHDSWETIRRKLTDWMHQTTMLLMVVGDRLECCQHTRPG